jgi:hypothetical protein
MPQPAVPPPVSRRPDGGLSPAIVRPDRMGRIHPDPRADPPTQALRRGDDDPPTDQLPRIGVETTRIPTVGPTGGPTVGAEATENPAADGERDDQLDSGSLLARFLGRRRARRRQRR